MAKDHSSSLATAEFEGKEDSMAGGSFQSGLPKISPTVQILGHVLPEAFFRQAKANLKQNLFFSKKNGRWVSTTYEDALDFVLRTMGGLRKAGFKKGDKICIFAENREEWILTDYAAQWLGGATAAIYTTSTADQIRYILNESEAHSLFLSGEAMLKKLSTVTGLTSLKNIIAWDRISMPSVPAGIKFISRETFLETPFSESEAESLLGQIKPNDLAILLYTSGTTGEPKGVMLSHDNIVSNLKMFVECMPSLRAGQVTISFLPLSHIYERALHNLMVNVGLRIYFAESVEKLLENIQDVRPQVMTAVPRIFEKMYAKINERIRNAPWLRRKIFYIAQSIGKKTFDFRYRNQPLPFTWGLLYRIADALVFKKIRDVTGGRAEIFISGGAPISVDIVEFFFRAGFMILEGYGTSEACIVSVNRPEKYKFGTVGLPFSRTEFRLAEDGEIMVRGPQVMKGYFKNSEATAEVMTSDGFYKTGDIGEIDSQGFVRITDRKKDLIKTSGGKYIAPQPIENSLKRDPLVEFSCVVGDRRKYVTALIVPNLEVCRAFAEARGQKWATLDDCARSEILQARFKGFVEEVNRDLPSYSTLKDFRILNQAFTIESGDLTPTLKLKRRVIQEKYKTLIDSMYPEDDGI